jgi:hypothetical protein
MKDLIKQAKKELRKVNKYQGSHSGVLKNYVKVNFPSLENGILDNFIEQIILSKFKNVFQKHIKI